MAIVYPANFTTSSSTNTDLDGTMVLSDAETVESYHSDALGDDTDINNSGGTGLNFKVTFTTVTGKGNPQVTTKYRVNATEKDNGDKYEGESGKDDPEAGVDDWEAVVIPPQPEGY